MRSPLYRCSALIFFGKIHFKLYNAPAVHILHYRSHILSGVRIHALAGGAFEGRYSSVASAESPAYNMYNTRGALLYNISA